MQTLGMTARQIRRMVNLESSLLCLIGSLTGILPGMLLSGAVTGQWSLSYMAGIGADGISLFLYFSHGFSAKAGKDCFQDHSLEGSYLAGKLRSALFRQAFLPLSGENAGKKKPEENVSYRLSMVAGGIFFLLTAAYISFWDIDLEYIPDIFKMQIIFFPLTLNT